VYQPISIPRIFLLTIAAVTACGQTKKLAPEQELFTSTAITQPKTFTAGAEGPAVDKEGNLYAVNFTNEGTVGIITPDGEATMFLVLPNGSIGNGIRFNSKGDMFIADYKKHNVLQFDMGGKHLNVYAHEPRMSQPNDIAIDRQDRLYASDPNWKDGTGAIWRIDTSGKVVLLENNMGTTNGIEVSPDNKTLYVNESVQRKVWAYDLATDGTISNKRLLFTFPDFGMDGMRCDVDGNLYITRHEKGTVVKLSPAGKILQEITLIGKKPSNIAFGGKDGRTAYVTLQDNGNIESFRVDKPGREWQMMQ
jgi:gluconolactonase